MTPCASFTPSRSKMTFRGLGEKRGNSKMLVLVKMQIRANPSIAIRKLYKAKLHYG
jgi:hypothetical protein